MKQEHNKEVNPLSEKELRKLKRQIGQRRKQTDRDSRVATRTLKIEFNR